VKQIVLAGLLLLGGLLVWTGTACSAAPPVSRDKAVRHEADAFGHYVDGWLHVLDARGLDRQGRTVEAGKAWLEAAGRFEQAAAATPDEPAVYEAMALAYLRLNRDDKLMSALQRLGKALPDTAEGRMRLAAVYEDIGQMSRAAEAYERALRGKGITREQRITLWRKLAELHRASGKARKALPYYEKLVAANPRDIDAHLGLAYGYSEANRHQQAIKATEALLALDREAFDEKKWLPRVLGFLASEYERAGRMTDGITRFERLLQEYPDSEHTAELLVLLYERANQLGMGIVRGVKFLKSNPDAHRLRLVLAGLYEKAHQPGKALALYHMILKAPAGKARPALKRIGAKSLLSLAGRLVEQEKHAAAGEAFQLLLDSGLNLLSVKNEISLRMELASLYVRTGESEKVLNVLRPLLSEALPLSVGARARLADLMSEAGRYQEAVSILDGQLKKTEDDKDKRALVLYTLAQVHSRHGHDDLSILHLKATLALDSAHAAAANHLGYVYAERDEHLDEALRLVESALKKEPKQPAYLDSLGWVYYKIALRDNKPKYLDMALDKLRQAKAGWQDAVITDHMGDVLFVAGRWEAARTAWEETARQIEAKPRPGPGGVDAEVLGAKLRRVGNLLQREKEEGKARKPATRMKKPLEPVRVEQQE